MNIRENISVSSPPPHLKKALRENVSFIGWRQATASFLSWAGSMAALHETTWRKAGIFEAIKASTTKIHKNPDLVLEIAEKWCPETNTFVFPWGETTITLEDVMVLLGFSVLGLPLFATLDSSEKKTTHRNLEEEWVKINKEKHSFVSQLEWMKRFMDSGDELEHAAFLALWLSYFVFPSCCYHISNAILPIAVHLSSGTRIAIAPAVLANLYSELSLLKTYIRNFSKSRIKIDLTSLFKLVQVWTWERFKELQPKPLPILNVDQPRLERWHDVRQKTRDARQILDNSKIGNFQWRPYTISVGKWKFPRFYPEKAMSVPVGPNLDDEFVSFARCIKVSALVGINSVEHYFPDRVATQFGMPQDVPASVNRSSLYKEAAWNDYNKPIEELILYIPSRSTIPCVTPTYSKWWEKTFPELLYPSKENQVSESADTSEYRNITKQVQHKYMKRAARENDESTLGHCQTQVPLENDEEDGDLTIAQMVRLVKKKNSGGDASEPLAKKSRLDVDNNDSGHPQKLAMLNKIRIHLKYVRDKRRKFMKQARNKRRKYMKQVPTDDNDEDGGLTIAQMVRLDKKKFSGGDASEPLGKTSRLDANNSDPSPLKKLASGGADDDSFIHKKLAVEELALKACSCGKIASGGANEEETSMGLSSNDESNRSDPHVGSDGAIDIVVLPPGIREICNDDELDVHGSNEDMIGDGSKEPPQCLLQEYEKLCNEAEKEDAVVADGRISESSPMVLSPSDESNIHVNVGIALGDGNQRQDCLLHENGIRSEETPKSSVQLEVSEKRKNDDGPDSFGKRLHGLKVLAASIEERINMTRKTVAWLKERRAIKQRKLTVASLI